MRDTRIAAPILAALVIAAIGAGLYFSGGFRAGAAEKRDADRRADLVALGSFVRCLADMADETLPETLAPSEACNRDVVLEDPYTGVPYTYERLSDTRFRVCATFERPEVLNEYQAGGDSFERSTGCMLFRYARGQD